MEFAILAGAVAVAALALLLLVRTAAQSFFRFRDARVVICPETRSSASVKVDLLDAVVGALRGSSIHRLADCSRWPERQACGQQCLEQVERAPEDCLVRNLLIEWYRNQHCTLCRKPFLDIQWHDRKPCLINADGITAEWRDFQPEKLPEVLETHRPVCWDCHIAQTFRRTRPDLIVDRERRSSTCV